MTRREEILLKEYAEACQAHRGIEQLSRTGLTILLTALGAVIGFVQFRIPITATDSLSIFGMQNALIELFGVVVSYGTSFMILRSQVLSKAYMGRIKGIEETL